MIIRKSRDEIETMGRAGRVVARTLELLGERAKPGVTTAELDEAAEEYIRSEGGVPTFKGYRGFPAAICTSPNSMVVHGIPGPYVLEDGDLISVDVGVTLDGFVADSAFTFPVGEVDGEAERLLEVGRAALAAGIEQARAGNHVQDISAAVQRTTEAAGFSVVRSLVGHGIGRSMHEEPQVPNFGEPGRRPVAPAGHDARDRADDQRRRARRVDGRRPLVDLDRRRLALGPFRAHGRDHRQRSRGAHESGVGMTGFATMHGRGWSALLRGCRPTPEVS